MAAQFRSYVWDPALIVSQMVLLQAGYYSSLGLWLALLGTLGSTGPSLQQVFSDECSGLAVLHPAREAVPGFHHHRSLLPPAGLLDLQLALPLDADVVAGAHRVHGADGGHRGVPVHENRAAGDPAQLRPQIQRIDCLWQQHAAFCHCSQHNASNASESSLKKHSRSV
ncbi:protein SYS1 homolog isoform X1 [Catharus ustulatus]|uniref:protein SYS1 homolog isoform X1 n=1 Tax=Catharus ustulatus TaxID=91951 RepID=UPI00140D368F|nr:protein SYS1 homolog isoform X1 [Catharus ustulatus]